MKGFMAKMTQEFKGTKTASTFAVEGTKDRAFLVVTGEAATNRAAMLEAEKVRKAGGDKFDTVVWRARMLARDF